MSGGGDGELDLDSLMASMGVRKSSRERGSGKKKGGAAKKRQRPAPARVAPRPAASPALRSQPPEPPRPPARPAAKPAVTPIVASAPAGKSAETLRLESELAAAKSRASAAELRLREMEQERKAMEKSIEKSAWERERLERRTDSLSAELKAVSEALSAACSPVDENIVVEGSLGELLKERGLKGRHEQREFLSTLQQGDLLYDLLHEAQIPNRGSLAHALRSKVLLHCGEEECPTIEESLICKVAAERCEVCGGRDGTVDLVEEMSEELMLNALRRVAIVTNGLARARTLLAQLHSRIEVRLVPPGTPAGAFEGMNLVIDWGDHPESDSGSVTRLRVKDASIFELSKRVCLHLRKRG